MAVDFSDDSKAALRWACGYAGQVGAEVVVLHVVHDPIEAPGSYHRSESDVLRPMEETAAEFLDEFIEKFGKAHPEVQGLVTLKTSLARGIPATRIVEVADKIDARMVVIGSRGPHRPASSPARLEGRAGRPALVPARHDRQGKGRP